MIRRIAHASPRLLALAVIGLPALLFGLYLGFVAADRYVSESMVTVRRSGSDGGGGLSGAALMLAGISPASHEDTLHLRDFILSQGLIERLEQRLQLRRHYGQAGLDLPYQLRASATREDFVEYYRHRVEVGFDDKSALLKLRTQGFSPDFARQLNQAILEECERFVNETSHRIARENMNFAEGELKRASELLQTARNELLTFQARHKTLDPTAQAVGSGALAMELQASRSRLEAELHGLLAFLKEDAFQVQTLKARIAAIDTQIAAERSRATAESRQGERLNVLAADFQALQMKAQFAQDAYKMALTAVESTRIESTRKLKNVVVVEAPTLPESAEYPLRSYNFMTLLTVCVLLFAILRLVLAIVREHQD